MCTSCGWTFRGTRGQHSGDKNECWEVSYYTDKASPVFLLYFMFVFYRKWSFADEVLVRELGGWLCVMLIRSQRHSDMYCVCVSLHSVPGDTSPAKSLLLGWWVCAFSESSTSYVMNADSAADFTRLCPIGRESWAPVTVSQWQWGTRNLCVAICSRSDGPHGLCCQPQCHSH